MSETDRPEDEHLTASIDPTEETGLWPRPQILGAPVAGCEDFNPRRQRSVTTVPTEDPARDKTIAGRLRPGFQAGDRLLRPELVSVYILRK